MFFHRSCVKQEEKEIQRITFLGSFIICFVDVQWDTWMEGLFCRGGRWQMIAACFRGFAKWKVYKSFWHLFGDRGKRLCTREQGRQIYLSQEVICGQLGRWTCFPFPFFSTFHYSQISLQILGIPNLTFLMLQSCRSSVPAVKCWLLKPPSK